MNKLITAIFICLLAIATISQTAFAAANPITPASSSAPAVTDPNAPPADYVKAINNMRENKYNENEIESFVYQVFSMFDRHVNINQLEDFFAEKDLESRLPEDRSKAQQTLEEWYAGMGAKYQSNVYTVEQLSVTIPGKSDYRVDLVVQWQALGKDGKFTSQRFHEKWSIVDGGGYWPRIVRFIVEPAP